MKLSGNDNAKVEVEATPDAASFVEPEGETTVCAPGCDCGQPSGNTKTKAAVSLIVLLAVVGILAYKALIAKENTSNNLSDKEASVFAMAQAASERALDESEQTSTGVKETMDSKSENSEAQPDVTSNLESPDPSAANGESAADVQQNVQSGPEAHSVKGTRKIGEDLESLVALNKVAMDQDAVFVFIPVPKNELVDDKTNSAVLAAQKLLKSNNITIGLYTLRSGTPDYAGISKQVPAPAILVASKGQGMAVVSGDVTETKLLQAYLASSSAAGCGPSGCGPVGCEPTPAAGK